MIEKAKQLNPKQNILTKNNYMKFLLVEKDGSSIERIILLVPDTRLREQIICSHFLSRYVQIFIMETTGVRYVSRDKPWDFEIELSNSECFFIEITSIADQEDLFTKYKYEERLIESTKKENIELRELEKLNFNFPNKEIEKLIEYYKSTGAKKSDLDPNPHFEKMIIFQSCFDENIGSFETILRKAIDKKVNKNHQNKQEVILIIDNRTVTFTLDQILQHFDNMYEYFQQLPFKEVWFYTGYYSDLDGSNAEYSLCPLKITNERAELIATTLK